MRLLHTSDWHLGHILYGFERMQEQKFMLEQMVSIVEEKKPDVFLLCGDVYHTSQPSSAAQTMFTEAILQIHNANPNMQIIITAGNHDSAVKHEIFREPWRFLNVHTIGSIDRENPENHIIEIKGKGFVIAVPYCSNRNMPEGFYRTLLEKTEELNNNDLPVVLSAHTTVFGCDFIGHDNANEAVVGGIESIGLESIGEGYDYFALGHIHKSQFVDRPTNKVRYCGTPLAVNFDERFSHTVSIVEIASHNSIPIIEKIEIKDNCPLVNLPTEGFASWEDVKTLLTNFPNDKSAYIRLNVEIENMLPSEAYEQANILMQDKPNAKLCFINTKRKEKTTETLQTMTLGEFRQESPIDIARKYAEYKDIVFDEDMQEIFNDVLKEIERESRGE